VDDGTALNMLDGPRQGLAGYVAPPSNMLNILSRRALPAGRLAALGLRQAQDALSNVEGRCCAGTFTTGC
jgi:hypothetical protein